MKKYLVLLLCCLAFGAAKAQLQGKFDFGQDGHVYFILTNATGYQIPVVYGVTDSNSNLQTQNYGTMAPYSTFVFGPNYNWKWMKGEKFIVTYRNQQTVSWTCPINEPSKTTFKGKGACRHSGCKCKKYVSANNGGKCVCGHWDYVHN